MMTCFQMSFVLAFNFIPHSPHRLDDFGAARRLVHLFPDMPDVNHDGIVIVKILFAPNGFKQLFRTDDLPAVLTQEPQDGEFGRGEVHRLFIVCLLYTSRCV